MHFQAVFGKIRKELIVNKRTILTKKHKLNKSLTESEVFFKHLLQEAPEIKYCACKKSIKIYKA
jgi:uncharacterized protein YjcR